MLYFSLNERGKKKPQVDLRAAHKKKEPGVKMLASNTTPTALPKPIPFQGNKKTVSAFCAPTVRNSNGD